jgi:threonine synthase
LIDALVCVVCGRRHAEGESETTCLSCGEEGILDVVYARTDIASGAGSDLPRDADLRRDVDPQCEAGPQCDAGPRRDVDLRRYADLPLRAPLSVRVGGTPIVAAGRLAAEIGLRALWIKDDGRNPTGSLKDRASYVAVARAKALGFADIACASTGNAASSVAGLAAAEGLTARIFVPATAPRPKIAQLLLYDADVFLVDGTYEVAFRLSQDAVAEFGWYNRNCAINPYLVEGKKTVGREIAEQLDAPVDTVVIAVGDGCCISGLCKGLTEMAMSGRLAHMPRVLGVQAEGAAPIAQAFRSGTDMRPVVARTIADSMCVGTPRNWRKAVRAVRSTGGDFVCVADDEIRDAVRDLARWSGVFAEPTAAATLAGVRRALAEGLLDRSDSVLLVITGTGLKDPEAALSTVRVPQPIAPDLDAVIARCA